MRHAEVELAAGICYGLTDVPADAAATRRAAGRLATRLPQGLAVQVSTLQRCGLLARELQSLRPDLSFHAEPRLREFDFGTWEGRAWAAVSRAEFDAWLADFAHARPGGGENVDDLMARVASVWDEWRAGGRDTAWITHAGVIRAARLLQAGRRWVEDVADWPAEAAALGDVITLDAP